MSNLSKLWNEYMSRSKRDFRCIKIGHKYVTCIEYQCYEPQSPFARKFDIETIEFLLDELDAIEGMNDYNMVI